MIKTRSRLLKIHNISADCFHRTYQDKFYIKTFDIFDLLCRKQDALLYTHSFPDKVNDTILQEISESDLTNGTLYAAEFSVGSIQPNMGHFQKVLGYCQDKEAQSNLELCISRCIPPRPGTVLSADNPQEEKEIPVLR